ncbi:peptide-methionine (S)-S-oxide reductase MsrA [Variovorax ginsengisoli]|jgi:peptide-methionine (S)-S-oxide reductase|uniref:Peptide methionine sulfoxide reductase MsrA n=1 Tax=Variovorax ginsengisoli TaxID=363844 RepID=A0ABT8SHR5_9BURK|nr:peptide-methionine (S)-S-oxide reductase MsrA [Variovorax ginsengisoli]MDN8618377.1 peptide-methionine (S)-S-oxide reductase MsrA [Variovorax ginsengisoli]MDO1537547.1 peptide-methionine (S)-S-oxide reductase MsrA [Variovorax ginsengisoli]
MNKPSTPPAPRFAGGAFFSRRAALGAVAVLAGAAAFRVVPSLAAESAVVIPVPADDAAAATTATETAVVAGGCFWGVQGVFQHVKGVTNAVSGYAGGDEKTAKYESVGSGRTGHAEAVAITYDPKQISYGRILQIYFSVAHNPTELNRQGPDHGTQYRSTIFAQNAEQARIAKAYIEQLDKARSFGQPIATTIELQKRFFPAEAYHQDYLTRNPTQPYIVFNDLPKIENLKKVFPDRYRAEPVLVGGRTAG